MTTFYMTDFGDKFSTLVKVTFTFHSCPSDIPRALAEIVAIASRDFQ